MRRIYCYACPARTHHVNTYPPFKDRHFATAIGSSIAKQIPDLAADISEKLYQSMLFKADWL